MNTTTNTATQKTTGWTRRPSKTTHVESKYFEKKYTFERIYKDTPKVSEEFEALMDLELINRPADTRSAEFISRLRRKDIFGKPMRHAENVRTFNMYAQTDRNRRIFCGEVDVVKDYANDRKSCVIAARFTKAGLEEGAYGFIRNLMTW